MLSQPLLMMMERSKQPLHERLGRQIVAAIASRLDLPSRIIAPRQPVVVQSAELEAASHFELQ